MHEETRGISLPRRELALAAGATAAVAALLLVLGPAPGDAPAHLYRTLLVRNGALIWDNLWYAGQYPLASYSLLYYFPAALVGNIPLVIGSAIASTAIFASIAFREWGNVARWPTRAFGVLAAAPIFTGLYSYSLGFATLLASLWFLQRGRLTLMIVLAALTLGFSPLAFVFLCLILVALVVAQRRVTPRAVGLTAALLAIAGVELAALLAFPTKGTYPFHVVDLAAVLAVCTVGALLARHSPTGRVFASFFVVWGLGSLLAYAVPTAVGDNLTRLRGFVFPLMLVVAAQARFRPRFLVTVALAGALLYNIVPYLMLIPYRLDSRPASAQFWRPAIRFLGRNDSPNYRVEVVPTAAHWESYWVPRAGYPLARGWYRQLDLATNPVLYRSHLGGAAYRAWLRRMGIKYVLLPATRLDPVGGPTEALLLRSGAAGLRPVFHDRNWTIYELPHPSPLLTGPAAARLTALGHQAIRGRVAAPGTYLLRVRFNPYWQGTSSVNCVRRSASGMTEIEFSRQGPFALRIPGSLQTVLDTITSTQPARC